MFSQKNCIKKSSFLHDILSSISVLQNLKGTNSVKFNDLLQYMEFTCNLSGDIESQVKSALNTAQDTKFILKCNNRYCLLSPAAKLHLVSETCFKDEIKRIGCIFQTKKRKTTHDSYDKCKLKYSTGFNKNGKSKWGKEVRWNPCKCSTPKRNKSESSAMSFIKNLWPATCTCQKKRPNSKNSKIRLRSPSSNVRGCKKIKTGIAHSNEKLKLINAEENFSNSSSC
ncbi:hypothetical protein ABEB36_013027 [Hypothenemus hampei]|uniref:Uncharacterized protein n=1 Tax=Hypothenemus hampei TaxID=57062 RepID=A0ABD1E6K2_HYPHA